MPSPNKITPLLAGALCVLIGAVIAITIGQVIILDCERPEGSYVICTRTSRWLGLVTVDTTALSRVENARVDEKCDHEGCTYSLRLGSGRGEIGLVSYYSSGYRSKARMAEEINTFIQDRQRPTHQWRTGPNLIGLAAAATFLVVGLALILHQARSDGLALEGALLPRRAALANSFDTILGPVAWQAGDEGLEFNFRNEARRVAWRDVTAAGMLTLPVGNFAVDAVIQTVQGIDQLRDVNRVLTTDYRQLILARGRSQTRAAQILVPILEPEAAVLVEQVRQRVGDRWRGEVPWEEQRRLYES